LRRARVSAWRIAFCADFVLANSIELHLKF